MIQTNYETAPFPRKSAPESTQNLAPMPHKVKMQVSSKKIRSITDSSSSFSTHKNSVTRQRGSVAFEYVIVTIFGVGLSLLIMSTAKKMIDEKLEAFQESLDKDLDLTADEDESYWP